MSRSLVQIKQGPLKKDFVLDFVVNTGYTNYIEREEIND
jgi:hypothetical protein